MDKTRKAINILFKIGFIMVVASVILHPLGQIILFGGFKKTFYNYSILGIYEYLILYWGGVLLVIPRLLWNIKSNAILKIFILLGLGFWGYFLYTGESKVGYL